MPYLLVIGVDQVILLSVAFTAAEAVPLDFQVNPPCGGVVNASLQPEGAVNALLEKGEKIFKKSGTCHNNTKDGISKVGPNLWNLINRPKADVSGFAYSKALADYGGKWTFEELNGFLYKPKEYIKGTKMNFAGLKNIEDRADLILWLRQHSDNPVPLP